MTTTPEKIRVPLNIYVEVEVEVTPNSVEDKEYEGQAEVEDLAARIVDLLNSSGLVTDVPEWELGD